jgi:hypothetical protein
LEIKTALEIQKTKSKKQKLLKILKQKAKIISKK